jgi:hypothetical protein
VGSASAAHIGIAKPRNGMVLPGGSAPSHPTHLSVCRGYESHGDVSTRTVVAGGPSRRVRMVAGTYRPQGELLSIRKRRDATDVPVLLAINVLNLIGMQMTKYFKVVVLGTSLMFLPVISAQDRDRRDNQQTQQNNRRYEDKAHHDSHEWNDNENQAYRHYLEERHRKYHEFDRANRREQNDFWNWRHSHPDTDRR